MIGEPRDLDQVHELEDRCERCLTEAKKHDNTALIDACRHTLRELYELDETMPRQRDP